MSRSTSRPGSAAVWSICGAALVFAAVAGLFVGPAGWEAAGSDAIRTLRVLRSGGAAATGACLGLAGLWLQSTTRNPLADPYLLGTSAGATLTVVASLTVAGALGLGAVLTVWTPALALIGALLASSLAMRIGLRAGGSPDRVVLAGLVITAFAGAATSLLLYRADDAGLRAATQWLMGGVVVQTPTELLLPLLVVVIGAGVAKRDAAQLDAMQLGRDAARGVGVDAAGMERRGAWIAAVLTAFAVALAGIVGFVGLLVPHGARALFGGRHDRLVPAVTLGGAAFLLGVDLLCRVAMAPAELPIGIPTALAGVPVLIGLFGGLAARAGLVRIVPPRRTGAAVGAPADARGDATARLAADGVSIGLDGGPRIVRAAEFRLPPGSLCVLLGPNGAGKSTLLRALAGALPADGAILDDSIPRPPGGAVSAERVVWLPQRVELPPGATVRELAGLPVALSDAPATALAAALADAGAAELADRPLQSLSGGQLQRALLAMALARPAPLLLLDEPTAALDPIAADDVFARLAAIASRRDATILAATHDLHAALHHAAIVLVLDGDGALRCVERSAHAALTEALAAAFGDGPASRTIVAALASSAPV